MAVDLSSDLRSKKEDILWQITPGVFLGSVIIAVVVGALLIIVGMWAARSWFIDPLQSSQLLQILKQQPPPQESALSKQSLVWMEQVEKRMEIQTSRQDKLLSAFLNVFERVSTSVQTSIQVPKDSIKVQVQFPELMPELLKLPQKEVVVPPVSPVIKTEQLEAQTNVPKIEAPAPKSTAKPQTEGVALPPPKGTQAFKEFVEKNGQK
jgi:hypothetical protein